MNCACSPKILRLLGVLLYGCTAVEIASATLVTESAFDNGSGSSFFLNYAYSTPTEVRDLPNLGPTEVLVSDAGQGTLRGSSFAPSVLSIDQTYAYNGTTIRGAANSNPGGLFLGRNRVLVDIKDANSENGYSAQGAYGSRSTVRFFTPGALADRAEFHFNVTGDESASLAQMCEPSFELCVTSRTAFYATTATDPAARRLNNVFSGLNETGAGQFSYSIAGMPLDVDITLLFWSSAFVDIDVGLLNTLGGDFFGSADYTSTFELTEIDLFDSSGAEISEWTMIDQTSQRTVFDQDGPVYVPIPVPATLMLVCLGLAGVGYRKHKMCNAA